MINKIDPRPERPRLTPLTKLPPTPTAAGRLVTAIHARSTMSRADATAMARLARSAAGAAAEELSELGVINILPPESAEGRGRPSPMLEASRPGPWVAVGELRTDTFRVAGARLGRAFTPVQAVDIAAASMPAAEVAARIGQEFAAFIEQTDGPCVGVALSLPGMVDPDKGAATAILSLDWHGVPIEHMLRPHLPASVPFALAQDAECAAVAEHRAGAGVGYERLLYLIGQAIGVGGLVVGSRSEWARIHHPLQAGHIVVDPSGPQCLCGAYGCLEVFVDGRALGRALETSAALGPEEFTALISRGLSTRQRDAILQSVVLPLKVGLVSLVNVLGPDRVVLGGVLGPLVDIAGDELRQSLGLSVVADVQPLSLARSALDDAVLIGAAEFAFGPFFQDPRAVLAAVSSPPVGSDT